ncbi:MAG: hypothetical protein QNJ45_06845 [Ardenticatenaceae bacterium]|nr:hypothetical protein [Ardenticatenaceae bacterium]
MNVFSKTVREWLYYAAIASAAIFGLLIAALSIWYLLPSPTSWGIVLGEVSHFPPGERPYRVSAAVGGRSLQFWVVNVDGQLTVFDRRNPGRIGSERWRCFISWNEATGRFEDPCSGDKYFLNGEPWEGGEGSFKWVNYSDRALDRYNYTVRGGEIILGEPVLGAQVGIDREIYCLQWPRECQ